MNPKTIFTVSVRLLGLVFVYHALRAVPPVFAGLIASVSSNSVLGVISTAAAGGWPFLVAVWLLRGAPLLMRLAGFDDALQFTTQTSAIPPASAPPVIGRPCVACGKPVPESSRQCPDCGWTQPA